MLEYIKIFRRVIPDRFIQNCLVSRAHDRNLPMKTGFQSILHKNNIQPAAPRRPSLLRVRGSDRCAGRDYFPA